MRMKDKCGTVTAAGSGMGRAGAVRLAREGAAVAVVDIDAAAVQAVVGEIESAGGRAVGIPADLTRDEDSRRIVREAANALGGIDFVWNHVGHPGPASVEGIEMEDFDTAVTLNLRTVLVTNVRNPRGSTDGLNHEHASRDPVRHWRVHMKIPSVRRHTERSCA